ncbi:hypothetical protein GCM10020000_16160 [Streptomyces olivoverticillatus]
MTNGGDSARMRPTPQGRTPYEGACGPTEAPCYDDSAVAISVLEVCARFASAVATVCASPDASTAPASVIIPPTRPRPRMSLPSDNGTFKEAQTIHQKPHEKSAPVPSQAAASVVRAGRASRLL